MCCVCVACVMRVCFVYDACVLHVCCMFVELRVLRVCFVCVPSVLRVCCVYVVSVLREQHYLFAACAAFLPTQLSYHPVNTVIVITPRPQLHEDI